MEVTPLRLAGSGRGGSDAAPHCSVSQANLIERCPLQWRFKYVERLPEQKRPGGPSENFTKGVALDRAITAACEGRADEAFTLSRPVANAYVAFMAWHREHYGGPLPEAQTRIVTVVPLTQDGINGRREPGDTVEFFGYLDLLYADGLCVDIKFGKAPDAEKLVEWQHQLSSYAAGDPRVTSGRVLRFGDSGLLSEHVIPLDVFDFGDWAARQVKRGPGAERHAPTPGRACSWCPYTRACAERCAEMFGG